MMGTVLRPGDVLACVARLEERDRDMGTKLQPGVFDCYAAAEPDEPFFVLLARDPMAPAIVRRWAAHRAMDGRTPAAQIGEALECADAMDRWREQRQAAREASAARPAEEIDS